MHESVRHVASIGALLALSCTVSATQRPTSAPAPTAIAEPEPIRCWWRTSAGAVATGEPFTLTLTCAVLDNETTKVTPDQTRLAAASVSLAPFEVMGGAHPADLTSGQRRFIQYDYTLRLIDADLIGRDAKVPDLQIHYRVESRVAPDSAIEGRDRIYVLPGIPLRILSLVPAEAPDIRDAGDASFAPIASLRFRARVFDILTFALAALGIVLLIPAAARLMGFKRHAATFATASLSERMVLRHVASELARAEADSRRGWNAELVSRVLTPLRVAAATVIGRRSRQRVAATNSAASDGGLLVTHGWRRRRRTLLVSPVTSVDLVEQIATLEASASSEKRHILESLRDSLAAFTSSAYCAEPSLDDARLDEALRTGRDAVERLNRTARWPQRVFTRAPQSQPHEERA